MTVQEEEEEEQNKQYLDSLEDAEHEMTISDQDLSILSKLDEDWQNHFSENESFSSKPTTEQEKLQTYIEQSICFEPSLHDQLRTEAHQTFEIAKELEIAEVLIGYIDQFGFMTTSIKK